MTAFLTIYLPEAHPQLHQIFSSLIHASCPGILVRDVGSGSFCLCDALLWPRPSQATTSFRCAIQWRQHYEGW